jgi:glucose-1-phosphate thymidylyltransferase
MSKTRKGILLCGGYGTRLFPITKYITKSFCPVYDKPLIYYPLYTLMKMGIKDILFISTPESTPIIEKNLGNGNEYGCKFQYKVQPSPNGIAQAFILGESFIGNDKTCLILGDNIFYGQQCEKFFRDACNSDENVIFGYPVSDPERYGVVEFDKYDNVISIEEKPKEPKSNYAIPGIYFYNNDVIEIAKNLKPSQRGEYEITDVNKEYLKRKNLKVKRLGFGNAYLDTGTFASLNDASNFVRTIEDRTGLKVSDLEIFKNNSII